MKVYLIGYKVMTVLLPGLHSRMLGRNCWAYTNAKVSRENGARQDAAAKIHNGCRREWDCYSQIKHQIVETLLWYAVMESYWRGDCNKNTNRREKEKRQKKKQRQRRSNVKEEAVDSSDVGGSHYAQYCCSTAVGTSSKCNRVAKGAAVYNVPPPYGVMGSWCWHVTWSEECDTAVALRTVLVMRWNIREQIRLKWVP